MFQKDRIAEQLLGKTDIEEERRLMYVAMSRARKNLYILYSGRLSKYLHVLENQTLLRNDDLYSRLKAWRNEEAGKLGMSNKNFCDDATLRKIADSKPRNLQELNELVPKQVAQLYAQQLLHLIQE